MMLDHTMLDNDERRAWEDIQRRFGEEGRSPDRTVRWSRATEPRGMLATAVAGGSLAVVLVVLGAPLLGLAIAVATVPRWLLWRYRSPLDGGDRPSAPAADRDAPLGTATGRPLRWRS
jgi:hypothetical protein